MAELTPKTINELTALGTVTGDELFAVMDGSNSRKMDVSDVELLRTGRNIPSSSDLNDYTEPGTYYCTSPESLSNCPTAAAFRMIVIRGYNAGSYYRTIQIIQTLSYDCVEYRRYYGTPQGGSSVVWNPWYRVSAKDLANAFDGAGGGLSFVRGYVPNGTAKDFTLEDGQRGVVIFSGVYTGASSMWSFFCKASDHTVSVKEFVGATYLTVTGGENKITVNNGTSGYTYALFIYF